MATILVADDDPITQRIVGFILTRLGHHVLHASNGSDAVHQVQESAPNLLILDIAMPEMDGLAALRQLRADKRFERLPIIMLTASGLEADAQAARQEGANDFVTKPFRSRELVDKLERLLG
jgi:CheY-like chemotaxis protein